MKRWMEWVFILLTTVHVLTGCGQSGKLYLPNQNPPEVQTNVDSPSLGDT